MEKSFNTNSYDYVLPSNLIAQTPIKNRSDSKLLVLNKKSGNIEHKKFNHIVDYLSCNDILVLNDTKVLPSRIIGYKSETNAKIEILLLKEIRKDIWVSLSKPQKRLKVGSTIIFSDNFNGQVIKLSEDGITEIKLNYKDVLIENLEKLGSMPLPPYIHESLKDNDRYQTVYASNYGSAAAPTAGLHFTQKLLDEIKKKGTTILYVTLHVGLGTFKPVSENDIRNHTMHSEYYEIDKCVAKVLNEAKKSGKRIISVGTTSLRTLESNYKKYGKFKSTKEETDIFIYPGYRFKAIDALITNFHLPKSTLLMLVSALAGRKKILNAYDEAIKNKYRFFSFGDAMFINNTNYSNKYNNILKYYNLKNVVTKDNFKIDKGVNNIILSAPHAHLHVRDKKNKTNEFNTANIAKIVSSMTGCHIIYTFSKSDVDHNNDESNYKKELSNYIKKNNIKYLIDIHGLNHKYDDSVIIGTNNYKNVFNDKKIINETLKIINNSLDESASIDKHFKASNENRISNYINNKNNIKTIQLEINKKYRLLNNRPVSFNKIIQCMVKIINMLNKEDLK